MNNKPLHVDVCVIGAGSGGLSVAAGAANLGFDVALIEKDKMGGDCLNTGCVPSKALLAAGKKAQVFRSSEKFGIACHEPDIDFGAVKDHISGVISKIEPHDSQERFEGLGCKVFRQTAKFIAPDTIQTGPQTIKARYFVIATGSRAAIPPIDGVEKDKVLTNETIFDLREKPGHLVIIGGGPIGIEMAQAHRRLGCKVTVLDIGPILPKDDPELVEFVRGKLSGEGVRLYENIQITSVKHTEQGVNVTARQDGSELNIKGSHLLIAAGRKPNIEDLDLETAGIKYSKTGITVDERLRTNRKNIYAIGDVAGGPQFTHVAGYHAGIVIKNMMFKIPARVDYAALPWVTYTDPELAQTGLTEAQAMEKVGRDKIHIVKWSLEENDRARAERNTEGLIKIITGKKGTILGASIVGPHAGELIGAWSMAISQGLKIGAFANMIAPYPTYGEISKRVGGAYYTPKLFSPLTRTLVQWLQKLPF